MEIITRQLALQQGLRHYFTGKPCKHGHISPRLTLRRQCLQCLPAYAPRRNGGERWKVVASACCERRLNFVYAYLRDDRTPYYVGIASVARRPVQKHQVGCVDLVPRDESRIVVLRSFLTRQQALAWEAFYIGRYKRIEDGGLLRNIALKGGGMPPGHVVPIGLVKARSRTRQAATASEYGLSLEAWAALTRGQKNVVRKRWLAGIRGDALLVNPPRKSGTEGQLSAGARKSAVTAARLGITHDAYMALNRAERSRVLMRYRAGWPAERLLEPARLQVA